MLEGEEISLPLLPQPPSLETPGELRLGLLLLVYSAPSFSIPGKDGPAAGWGLLLSSRPRYLFESRLAGKNSLSRNLIQILASIVFLEIICPK